MKEFLKKTFIYKIYLFFKYLVFPLKLKIRHINNKKPNNIINSYDKLKTNVVVSLTSFPGRINIVHKTIYSLMNQKYKPDLIVLWLSKKQFPNMEKDLCRELLELRSNGLCINWLEEDIKSYKKLIPALKKYENDIIVTADDDLYYPDYWLERLIDSYKKNKNDIHCHLVTKLDIVNGKIKKSMGKAIPDASYLYKILGGSGALYPPHSLSDEVLNNKKFLSLAPTSDDIWFWGMAVKNHVKIRLIDDGMKKLTNTEYSQEETECLYKINDGELFYKHLNNIFEEYELKSIILDYEQ